MGQHLRVLIVEDQPTDAELLQYDMRRAGLEFIARRVETQEAFELALKEFEPDVLGRSYEEVLPRDRAAALASFLRQVIDSGRPVSRTYRTGSGDDTRWWCANYFPIPGADGKLALIGTVAVDVTEHKRQAEGLD
jgi:PAS domain-containing protein